MKIAFSIIVFIHGITHIIGFIKAFGIKEVKEMSLPISKTAGLLWLTATVLFSAYGIQYINNARYGWVTGLAAVVISQTLILLFWKDAKFGTLLNVIILPVLLTSLGRFYFQRSVENETKNLLNTVEIVQKDIILEQDLHKLPVPVKKWLMNSGIVGKPIITTGQVKQHAKIKLDQKQEDWYTANAHQYTTIANPGFIWTIDLKMNSLIHFQGRDKFENGKGEMLIKINSLFNIVNEHGEKLNEGTMQRFLGEMVWFPSMALSPYITWHKIDDTTARATMSYNGTAASGTFHFNPQGEFIKFSTMRFKDNDPDAERYEWILLVENHKSFEGIKIPNEMTATWKLENQDWTWLQLKITDVKYNDIGKAFH